MDKKSKIFIVVFFILIFISIGITFHRIVIKKDYVIETQVDCDPETETCFIWQCDPDSKEEGEACTADPDENIWYYKIARRNASKIPLCDPNQDDTCLPMVCPPGEKDCSETLCDEISAEEQGVSCNDPEEYLTNNPPEEEEEEGECEEGDEECADSEEETVECDSKNSEECQESEDAEVQEANSENIQNNISSDESDSE